MSIIKKVEVLASCRVAMVIPFRVCAAVGIVLLAVSCATTTTVNLPALDASVTTEAEALVVYTDTDYVVGFVAPGGVIRGKGAGAMQGMGDYLSGMFEAGEGAIWPSPGWEPVEYNAARISFENRFQAEPG